MPQNLIGNDSTSMSAGEALKVICFYLAQKANTKKPHEDLGFKSSKEAFENIGKKFGRNSNTVKNYRDKFDAQTDSERVGWYQRELGAEDKSIIERYKNLDREELLALARDILSKEWGHVSNDEVSSAFDIENLVDLDKLRPSEKIRAQSGLDDFALPAAAIRLLNEKLNNLNFTFNKYSGYHFTGKQYAFFSNQYFYYILKLKSFALELYKYCNLVESNKDKIEELINTTNAKSENIELAFKNDAGFVTSIGEDNLQLLARFLGTDRKNWNHPGKNIINDDGGADPKFFLRSTDGHFISEILKVVDLEDVSSAVFGKIVYAICELEGLFDALEEILNSENVEKSAKGGENILYYGAPGTGKSYAASKEAGEDLDCVFRTLFHPDMQNSDFFGTLKPATDENGQPIYKFREGPFTKALTHARDNPSKRVYLIIEELNRAMAAAVFGELFQLLDRDADGTSEYSVDAPSDEFAESYGAKKIKLPSNLWILATMNSADQGVYPLDTAFRRRWRQVYIPIDYSIAPKNSIRVSTLKNPDAKISWQVFVEGLNKFLTAKIDIPEDRLIGPRFVKEPELESGLLPGKLLIYLWDDLLRHHGRHTLFTATLKTYGELDRANSDGKPIFNQVFLDALELDPSET